MTSSKKLVSNFFYTTLFKVVRTILPLITVPYISRVLGPEKLGIFDYTYSIVVYFEMFALLGFENHGSRLIAEHRDDQDKLNLVFTSAYCFQIMSSLIAIFGYAAYVTLFCKRNIGIAWIQILFVIAELFDINWFYFGLENFKMRTLVNIGVRLVTYAAIFTFVRTREDLPIYAILCAGTMLLCSLILWIGRSRYVKFVRVTWKDIWKYGKGAIVLFFPVVVISIYRTMDKIMLGNMYNMAEVAIYANADKIVEVPYNFLAALGIVMLPRMTNYAAKGDTAHTQFYIEKSMRLMLFMGCGIAFGMLAVGKVFAPVFFGPEFIASGILIMVISPQVIFRSCANVVRNQYLLPQKRDKDYIVSILIGVVINLVFNTLMIPRWGASGAAIATLFAESFVALYQVFVCRKELPVVQYTLSNWFFLVAGAIMFVPVYLFGMHQSASVVTLLLQIAMGVVIYFAIGGTYLYQKEKPLIRSLLKK